MQRHHWIILSVAVTLGVAALITIAVAVASRSGVARPAGATSDEARVVREYLEDIELQAKPGTVKVLGGVDYTSDLGYRHRVVRATFVATEKVGGKAGKNLDILVSLEGGRIQTLWPNVKGDDWKGPVLEQSKKNEWNLKNTN